MRTFDPLEMDLNVGNENTIESEKLIELAKKRCELNKIKDKAVEYGKDIVNTFSDKQLWIKLENFKQLQKEKEELKKLLLKVWLTGNTTSKEFKYLMELKNK